MKIFTHITITSAINHLKFKIQVTTLPKFMRQESLVILFRDTIRFGEGQLIFGSKYNSVK